MFLLDNIKNKSPRYDLEHEGLIEKLTAKQGGVAGKAASESVYQSGQYFETKYEIFMYAAFLGLKANYSYPVNEGKTFWEMKHWKPSELVHYLILCVLGVSDIDFFEVEQLEEKPLDEVILRIIKSLEEYANGGFSIMRGKLNDNPHYIMDDNYFVELLGESFD